MQTEGALHEIQLGLAFKAVYPDYQV